MMAVKVFTLAFDPFIGGFNDLPLREFLADKDVESVSDHFFVKDGTPYLALVARYRLAALPGHSEPAAKSGRQRDESWRETLAKEHWPLFNTLRDWRGERAKREGIPSYVICNNRQLAELVEKRPASSRAAILCRHRPETGVTGLCCGSTCLPWPSIQSPSGLTTRRCKISSPTKTLNRSAVIRYLKVSHRKDHRLWKIKYNPSMGF